MCKNPLSSIHSEKGSQKLYITSLMGAGGISCPSFPGVRGFPHGSVVYWASVRQSDGDLLELEALQGCVKLKYTPFT